MNFKKIVARNTKFKLVIEEDFPEVGVYLYVYNNENKCIKDFLQDNIEICKKVALRDYGIKEEDWKELD